ncbi:regulator of Vps4 activity in the MVB pathway-domain-containing protein [Trichophaea hybrida]|nr:regulator of Vps4 activity in the MVB pathway-domain-containing protein [Trichophaea hybrida]
MAPTSTLVSKLKVALKLSISRLRMAQQKESALSKVARRQMAQLLEVGKEESARIRVENIIRQDISVELMEILELYCELLLARIGLMEAKECDPGLEEPIKSLIYAAPRTEVKELQTVRQLLVEKYGKEFALAAIENSDKKVSERVLKKLRVEPPEEILPASGGIALKLTEEPIAVVDPKAEELAKATPPKQLRSPINVAPPSPSSENVHPVIRLPDAPKMANLSQPPVVKPASKPQPTARTLSDDNDLARRFAALKRP